MLVRAAALRRIAGQDPGQAARRLQQEGNQFLHPAGGHPGVTDGCRATDEQRDATGGCHAADAQRDVTDDCRAADAQRGVTDGCHAADAQRDATGGCHTADGRQDEADVKLDGRLCLVQNHDDD